MEFDADAITFATYYSYSSEGTAPGKMVVAGTEVQVLEIDHDRDWVLLRTADGRIGVLDIGAIERYELTTQERCTSCGAPVSGGGDSGLCFGCWVRTARDNK